MIKLEEEACIAIGALEGSRIDDGYFESSPFRTCTRTPVSTHHVVEDSLMALDCKAQCLCAWGEDSSDGDHHCILAHIIADNQHFRSGKPSCSCGF